MKQQDEDETLIKAIWAGIGVFLGLLALFVFGYCLIKPASAQSVECNQDEVIVIPQSTSGLTTLDWIGRFGNNDIAYTLKINVDNEGDTIFIDSLETEYFAPLASCFNGICDGPGWTVDYNTPSSNSVLADLTCGLWTDRNGHRIIINCNNQGFLELP